jgi:L-alanine-DL-glutamate epimerase-like enolase superfamily enzyme
MPPIGVPAGDRAVPVDGLTVHAFDIPVDGPDGKEQDGTLTWESVTIILVEARAGGQVGIGYTYGDVSTASLVESKLTEAVRGPDAMAPPAAWRQMMVQLRNAGPPGLDLAAGEYGYLLPDFAALLDAEAVDCLQADVTRCGGITGLLQVGGLAEARQIDLSGHCAPAVSAHAFCAVPHVRHLEYFHTHVRLEGIVFDGTLSPAGGALRPDHDRPGLGLEVKWADLEQYRAYGKSR